MNYLFQEQPFQPSKVKWWGQVTNTHFSLDSKIYTGLRTEYHPFLEHRSDVVAGETALPFGPPPPHSHILVILPFSVKQPAIFFFLVTSEWLLCFKRPDPKVLLYFRLLESPHWPLDEIVCFQVFWIRYTGTGWLEAKQGLEVAVFYFLAPNLPIIWQL